MHREELSEKLLATGCFISNEWFDKYVNLIANNKDTKYESFKTNKHHIIPRYYYKLNNLAIDNTKCNIVNLYYRDHVLAHYYLSKCAVDDYNKMANVLAVKRFCNNERYSCITEEWLKEALPLLQELYEESLTEISKYSSKACSGKIAIVKGCEQIFIYPDVLDSYISQGWCLGTKHKGQKSWNAGKTGLKCLGHNQKGENNGNFGIFKYTNGIDYIRCKEGEQPDGYTKTNYERVHHKKVLCIETNTVYRGVAAASKATGISKDHIRKMCRSIFNNDRAFIKETLHFRYA